MLADIGIEADGDWHEIGAAELPPLDPGGHKYDRGLVHALAGEMPGAIALAATAAARAGAGYVRVSTSRPIDGLPVGDRPDRQRARSTTSGSAACSSARAWATFRRC